MEGIVDRCSRCAAAESGNQACKDWGLKLERSRPGQLGDTPGGIKIEVIEQIAQGPDRLRGRAFSVVQSDLRGSGYTRRCSRQARQGNQHVEYAGGKLVFSVSATLLSDHWQIRWTISDSTPIPPSAGKVHQA